MSFSGLPTPPTEDHKSSISRRPSKPKSPQRVSKRSSTSEQSTITLDSRHKRVWKACERCRMKKTKCDGESPCRRCKDDGLVCTAGSRKKTEYKQLPRGYAEVLENTNYALIHTVQKLYNMVRNNEPWDFEEPELNERGQPVIHDIASKLGCIRQQSPDLPFAFPEGEKDLAELQAQLQAARSEMAANDFGAGRKQSQGSTGSYSPALEQSDRASSVESDHSMLSKEDNQMLQNQRPIQISSTGLPQGLDTTFDKSFQSVESIYSVPSPIFSDFHTESPVFRNGSPFAPWSDSDFLGATHALDTTAQYLAKQPTQTIRPSPMAGSFVVDPIKLARLNNQPGIAFADGTIRPNMLDFQSGYEMDQMEINWVSAGQL